MHSRPVCASAAYGAAAAAVAVGRDPWAVTRGHRRWARRLDGATMVSGRHTRRFWSLVVQVWSGRIPPRRSCGTAMR